MLELARNDSQELIVKFCKPIIKFQLLLKVKLYKATIMLTTKVIDTQNLSLSNYFIRLVQRHSWFLPWKAKTTYYISLLSVHLRLIPCVVAVWWRCCIVVCYCASLPSCVQCCRVGSLKLAMMSGFALRKWTNATNQDQAGCCYINQHNTACGAIERNLKSYTSLAKICGFFFFWPPRIHTPPL